MPFMFFRPFYVQNCNTLRIKQLSNFKNFSKDIVNQRVIKAKNTRHIF